MTEQELIKRAIESAKCRIYRVKAKEGESHRHQTKVANQVELQLVTIKALEKQIPKKPFQPFGTHSYKCSNCWKFVAHEVDDNCDLSQMAEWCPFCGQKLDWGNEDAE